MQHFSLFTNKKNLLAFSAGIDSSALFFLLKEQGISFDIALVNYGVRSQSDVEEQYALELAREFGLQAHIKHAPRYSSHFEANARAFRYEFFDSLVEQYNYDNIITAHQLNDQLEWLLMRLTKGAGLCELVGLESSSIRYTSKTKQPYRLLRPLLDKTKDQLLTYLQNNGYRYFIDESNRDHKYERNRFRQRYSDDLLMDFADGIRRSFEYLHHDKEQLLQGIKLLFAKDQLRVYELSQSSLKSKAADLALKELGYLLSSAQRREIESKDSIVIGGNWAVVFKDERLYIAPFMNIAMPKEFKELCRVSSLPIKIRSYCYNQGIKPMEVMSLLY